MTTIAISAGRGAGLLVGTLMVAKRVLLKYIRTPQLVLGGAAQMTLFLVCFRYVFGGAVNTSGGVSYVDFLVPGFVATGVLFAMIASAVGVAEDLEQGFVDRLRSLPIPRSALLTGRLVSDTLITTLNLAIATAVGFLVGFRLHGSVAQGLAAFGMCMVFAFAFGWVFIAMGLFARTGQAAQQMSMAVFPFTFLSSAYVPVASMPAVLRVFAENQSITPMVDSVRALTLGAAAPAILGHDAAYFVVRALVWAAIIVVVFAPVAILRYRRS